MSVSCMIIETPKGCEEYLLSYQKDSMDMCPATGCQHNTANERPEWCPLQELPQHTTDTDQTKSQTVKKIFDMLDLFYANKHMSERLQRRTTTIYQNQEENKA